MDSLLEQMGDVNEEMKMLRNNSGDQTHCHRYEEHPDGILSRLDTAEERIPEPE